MLDRLDAIDKTIDECLNQALYMHWQLKSYSLERRQIEKKVIEAKNWLQKQPEYLSFLQQLQMILQQQNIGAFSQLLSYFIKDVLDKDKEIIFDLYTYRNLPALRIEALNDGNREDIFDGSGGSVVNVVSTGLRLIALSRLHHRKFIVLDEPDCWLKPDSIPIFAKIIGDIASKLNIQTVIISHHNWAFFKDYGRVIELRKEGAVLTTEIINDIPHPSNENDDYIQSITLNNFMSHQNTTFELHPHLTCIIGELDIGKSVLGTAIRAVAYNDSSDAYIKHHQDMARVIIELTGGRSVQWQRILKTNQEHPQKVKYTLLKNGVEVATEYNASDTPDFINRTLNICTTEDIDVHIGHQKQPVFLLSKETKPAQRAKILSLGKESIIIQKMMESIKQKTRQYRQTEKEGDKLYAQCSRIIDALNYTRTPNESVAIIQEFKSKAQQIRTQESNIKLCNQMISEIQPNLLLSSIEKIDTSQENYAFNQDIKHINSLVHTLSMNERLLAIKPVLVQPCQSSLTDTHEISRFINQLSTQQRITSIDKINISEEYSEIHNTNELSSLIDSWQKNHPLTVIDKVDIKEEQIALHDIFTINALIANMQHISTTLAITPVVFDAIDVNMHNISELNQLIDTLMSCREQYQALKGEQRQIEKEMDDLEQKQEKYLQQINYKCPTCHQSIDKEHFTQGHK